MWHWLLQLLVSDPQSFLLQPFHRTEIALGITIRKASSAKQKAEYLYCSALTIFLYFPVAATA